MNARIILDTMHISCAPKIKFFMTSIRLDAYIECFGAMEGAGVESDVFKHHFSEPSKEILY